MTTSAEEAEREVEASRGQLDRTMDAIKDRLTPGQLLDEGMRTMGGAGNQVAKKLLGQAKENPMPLAVMGLGLAWLMTSNHKAQDSAGRSREGRSFASATGSGDGGSDPSWTDTASDKLHDATDAAKDALGSARDNLAGAGAKASDLAGAAKDKIGQTARKAQDTFSDLLTREPLLIAGLGLVVGLAAGAALPGTEAEGRLIGPVRDRVIDKTKALAQDRLEDVGEVTQAAYGGVKQSLRESTGGDLSEVVGQAAQSGVAAAKNKLEQSTGQGH